MGLFSNDRNTRSTETPSAPAAQPEERRPPRRSENDAAYGIDKAIKLMRTLPVGDENIEIVVQVIKNTLESINVHVASIIEDATRKQESTNHQIDRLENEVSALEAEIADRRTKIATLRSDYAETTKVKERLILAEELSAKEAGEARKAAASDDAEKNPQASTYHLV